MGAYRVDFFNNNERMSLTTTPVSWQDVMSLHLAYWEYRNATIAVPWDIRTPNMPERITEGIVCLCTKGKLIVDGHGDILLPNNLIGEVKGTSSSSKDLSSFSPSSNFDKLYFVHVSPITTDEYYVYDLKRDRRSLMKIKVNATETFKDHCTQERRPRFSIFKEIILPEKLSPTWKVDMSNGTIRR